MKSLLLFVLLSSISLQAQYVVSGTIKDGKTGEALPFANITASNASTIVADVDGKFRVECKFKPDSLVVSYIGFQSKTISVSSHFYIVKLSRQTENLNEVILGEDDATAKAIMRKVIAEKSKTDPQKKLYSFQFKSYNKLIITANPDSIDAAIDSVFIEKYNRTKFAKLDSSNYKLKNLLKRQHLFQTEKISQFQFRNSKLKETILATKMAGFSQPLYEVIALNLQSFSIYDNTYVLLETRYKSPIADNAPSNYNFKLLDTVSLQQRKVYLIYFKPKNKKNTLGLRGLLYIDAENYAIAGAIMRINSVLNISATHEYNFLKEHSIWFPATTEFKIVKGKNDEDIRILGETLKFDADNNDNIPKRKKQASDFTYLVSKSHNFDAEYNLPIVIRKPSIAIQIGESAIKKEEAFWSSYRKDTLDARSAFTYIALDSIAKKEKIEKKLRIGRKVLNGYLPLGPVDLDLRYLLSFNNYEGFRFGIGGVTSEKFSQIYKIEGYSAYGTKDGAMKYNLGAATRIGKFSTTWIGAAYTDDVREIASTTFAIDKRVFKLYDPRPINVSTFYGFQSWRAYIETKMLPKSESIWQLTHSRIDPKFEYAFLNNATLYNTFFMTTAMVSIQWNPFSDYMQTPTGRLEIEKRFPKFTFQITQALPGVLDNDFKFSKFDFRAEYEKKYLNGQKSAFLIEAGYAHGAVPITHLYNTSPNNLTKERLIQRITIAGKNSFETMYFNEFFSSEYALFQLKHGFKRVKLFRNVKPALVLVSRMAWGNMKNPEQHVGIGFKTLDKGFFESGIELNQIFRGFGLTGFYRYGPNQLPRLEDNIAIKLSFVLNLGI